MRRLAVLVVVAFALVPAGRAVAKEQHGPVSVSWNGVAAARTPPGGTWDARFTLARGGLPYYGEPVHPVVVVTDLESGTARRIAAVEDGAGHAFRASVPFPRAGAYWVELVGYDSRRPEAISDAIPVRIGSPPGGGGADWLPWTLVALAAFSALLAARLVARRVRGAAAGPRGADAPASET